ncbi:946_t:CDS:2, partial [Entrophospora sp. SA101]
DSSGAMKRPYSEIKDEITKFIDDNLKKIKTVELSIPGWYSCPATHTETEKGKMIHLVGEEFVLPFTLTDLTLGKRHRTGLFKKKSIPIAQKGENIVQKHFINECNVITRSFDEIQYVLYDVHDFALLDTQKPDFLILDEKHPLDPLNVIMIGEIRLITAKHGRFSDADVGHATSFGEKLLQLQPRRAYVYVLLTDCHMLMIIHVSKISDDKFQYKYTRLAKLESDDGKPAEGWKQLVTLLLQKPETLGWITSYVYHKGEEIKLSRSIGVGRTSVVYEGIYNDNEVAVKVLKDPQFLYCFKLEVNVMQKLAELNSSVLLKCLFTNIDDYNSDDSDPIFVVLFPLCRQYKNWRKEDIPPIIDTLKKVHDMGIIHRDFRKWNLLRDQDGNVCIADWGFAVDVNESTTFAGSLETLSDDALQNIIDEEDITYTCSNELISVVRSFYLMVFRPLMKRPPFGENKNGIKERAKEIKEFWMNNARSSIWLNILKSATDTDYDNLKKLLMELF